MKVSLYELISIIVLVSALLATISIVYASWKNGISPMPSSLRVREVVVKEINRLGDKGVIVEAGSGWGTLGIHIGKQCGGWRIIGIENSSVPLWFSKIWSWITFRRFQRVEQNRKTSVTFRRGNIYNYTYEDTSLVICYLYPGAMKQLSAILREKLPPSARVISACFALPEWQPEKVITCTDIYRTQVYIYRVGDNV
ncbi:class I SAM-dependent methyltransferase [Cohnella abietis]|uniref:SAM-dependent methyltransferase n=1 Tax=Cohnella abietis TaxID=2507935 RepID=A0A3T1DEE1_9BACL|nr:class I SAM-dependent methyltransferase [Cohnella abietis]BBI36394.1 hypothetical protein KCTCHS21_57930 [Cohnella abietis]